MHRLGTGESERIVRKASPEVKNRSLRLVLAGLFAFVCMLGARPAEEVVAASAAGKLTRVVGSVEIRRLGDAGGKRARRWMNVFVNDILETGDDGRVQILLTDQSVMTLSPGSKLRISEQLYNPKKQERRSIFNLFRGKVRSLVSKYVNAARSKFEIHTPTAVAGVRGSTCVTAFDPASGSTIHGFENGNGYLMNPETGESLDIGANQVASFSGGNLTLGTFSAAQQRAQRRAFQIENGNDGGDELPTDTYEESSEHVDDPSGGDDDDPSGGTAQNDQGGDQGDQGGNDDDQGGGGDDGDTGQNDLSQKEDSGGLPVELEPPASFSRVRVLINLEGPPAP